MNDYYNLGPPGLKEERKMQWEAFFPPHTHVLSSSLIARCNFLVQHGLLLYCMFG